MPFSTKVSRSSVKQENEEAQGLIAKRYRLTFQSDQEYLQQVEYKVGQLIQILDKYEVLGMNLIHGRRF